MLSSRGDAGLPMRTLVLRAVRYGGSQGVQPQRELAAGVQLQAQLETRAVHKCALHWQVHVGGERRQRSGTLR